MTTRASTAFGGALKRHRSARRLSQLALASEALVSQRHLSFLETGRSRPSREMVIHLGLTMGLNLREQNDLLLAAGFAPAYSETSLDEPAMDEVRHVLDLLLAANDPFPAFVVDRHWNAALMNRAGARLAEFVTSMGSFAEPLNLLRVALHPDGMRRFTINWEEVARHSIQRLYREVLSHPTDTDLADLYDEVRAYPEVPSPNEGALPSGGDLLISLHYRLGDSDLRLISTITTIGAAHDVTLEELRMEVSYPADAQTEAVLRSLAEAP